MKKTLSITKAPSIAVFLLVTFSISYGLWAICIAGQYIGLFPPGSMWFMPFYVLGGNALPIAVWIVFRRTDPEYTFKIFVKEIFDFKQKPTHYLLTAVMVALFFVVPAIIGGIDTATSPGLEARGMEGHIPIYLTLLAIPFFFFGGGNEELGWRWILQPGLERKMPFLPATLVTAAIWTVWHLPLWWIDGTGQGEVDFLRFFITVIGFSFGLAAIRRVSGSVILCVLFHCAINSIQGSYPVKDELWVRIITTSVYILFAMIVVVAHKVLSKKRVEERND